MEHWRGGRETRQLQLCRPPTTNPAKSTNVQGRIGCPSSLLAHFIIITPPTTMARIVLPFYTRLHVPVLGRCLPPVHWGTGVLAALFHSEVV